MDLINIENTKIDLNSKYICIERYEEYLYELKKYYPPVFSNIEAIVDDYKRGQGIVEIQEKAIPVYGMEYLSSINWNEYKIIILSDYYIQAFENIQDKYEKIYDNKEIYYFLNDKTKQELIYRDMYEKDDLRDLIVFRSGPHETAYVKGMDFSDNARALFEYMIENKYNEKYKLVWFVKNADEFKEYDNYYNIEFVSFDWASSDDDDKRRTYYDVLFHAKYLFFTDAYGFARNCRKDQVRVQLWHGCGLKTRTNFVPCEKRYELNTVVSDKYAELHIKMFGLRPDQVLVTGHPKTDWLFHPVAKEKMIKMGIQDSPKYIFWLPTFRTADDNLRQLNEFAIESETGLPLLYNQRDLVKLNALLREENIMMIIKLHPFQKKNTIKCTDLSNIVLLENEQLVAFDVHINQLLGWADALISDYSSVAIDYLALDRPIAFTLDDVEEYKTGRGFHFDNIRDWLPGKELYTIDDFFSYIKEIGKDIDTSRQKRERLRLVLNQFDDDKSSKRILDYLGIVNRK